MCPIQRFSMQEIQTELGPRNMMQSSDSGDWMMVPPRMRVLLQCMSPTWDGDVMSKHILGELHETGMVERDGGWSIISHKGILALVQLGFLSR